MMVIYALFNEAGFASAFWPETFFPPIEGEDGSTQRHPAISESAIVVTADQHAKLSAEPGLWRLVEGEIVAYVRPLDILDLVAYAADRRWRKEVGGIVVAGIPIATDDRSKMMITGARLAAAADPGWGTTWHGADGSTYPVDAAAIIEISDQVQTHVNASFATFAAVKAEIDAGSITSTDQIDAAFGA